MCSREQHSPLSIADFTNVFQDHVRVLLDFTRLNDDEFLVRAQALSDPMALLGWVSPWYVDENGNECDYGAPEANPIPLLRSDGEPIPAPPSHARRVARIVDSFSMIPPAPILIGAYAPDGRDVVVVIDGNHRLRALLANRGPIHILALILHGPDDPAILRDLPTSDSGTS